jgi:hypothetical protein
LLTGLGFPPSGPTTLFVDNQSAIALTANNQFHDRSKHIDIQYHAIRDRIEEGSITIEHVPSEENTADVFTKPLAAPLHARFTRELGLLPN